VEARRQFEVNEQIAETTVNVTVRRNEFEPRFTQSEYRKSPLAEKTPVGTSIVQVTATDRDGVSVACIALLKTCI